jgi:cell volume regulation protein A
MPDLDLVLVLACVLVLASILASKASGWAGVPALLLFLGIGMLAGSEGLLGIYFDDAWLARAVGVIALALILYSGGLDTRWESIRPVMGRGVTLAAFGTLLTAGLLGLFVAWVSDLPLLQSLLLGAVVSSTDAAAVFTVLRARQVRLPEDVRSLLELESGTNDPMAVFLTVSIIAVITSGEASALGFIASFLLQMGLGLAFGYAFGRGMSWVLNRVALEQDGLYPVLSLSLILLTFGVTQYADGSGFLAVYIAGLVMSGRAYTHKRSLARFHDGLAWLGQIAMFLTLGLLVFPSDILPVLGMAVLITAFLTLVARPFAVYVSLLRSRFSLREQTLVGWAGLRGAVPIILATFPLVAGISGGETLFNIVFFVVLASALIQGTTVPLAARWLGVEGTAFEGEPAWAGEPVHRDLAEFRVPETSPLVGRRVSQAGLPGGADAVLLRRYDAYVVVRGSTRLRRDDVILLLADDPALRELEIRGDLMRQPVLSVCEVERMASRLGT